MVKRRHRSCMFCVALCSLIGCADRGPSPAKKPSEELLSFKTEPGLTIQLVASEPMVQDPVVITFDQDGRLWVVEMRGFMPDIDGKGEGEPVGRVSVLEDRNGDGVMDFSTIYIDSLIMPRAIAVIKGGALIAENEALWLTKDLNGDLQADSKTLIDPDYAGSPLPEHSGNGLWRGIDNWYYNAKSRFRYRLVDGQWKRDSTEFRGQWGISHDDKGRLYYNYNWSQLHADLLPPNYLSRNKNHTPTSGIDHGLTLDRRVYPIRPNPAVNRGYIPGTLDQQGHLVEFTAACSPHFYRGSALPDQYYGNVFVCEPSGNLVKRDVVIEEGITLGAYDPHPGREFLASTDERFRPVYIATGPDGALYIADMYRGLVQHGAHVTPYLREQTISRKLVQPINRGRIWRVVPENWNRQMRWKGSAATAAELIDQLSDADGWHRDMAQRMLIDRGDKGVLKALSTLALHGENYLGRFHALWTMEGLHILDPGVLSEAFHDKNSLVRTTALRLLEPFAENDNGVRTMLEQEILDVWERAPVDQILQITLTTAVLNQSVSHQLLEHILERYDTSAVMRDAVLSSLQGQEFIFMKRLMASAEWKIHKPEKEIFLEMLTTSIIHKRNPGELAFLLAMLNIDKASFGWREQTILTGFAMQASSGTLKPVSLVSAPKILSRADLKIDSSRLYALTSIFQWPGHAPRAMQVNSLLNESEKKQFTAGRQRYLTTCAGCHGIDGAGLPRFGPSLIRSDWVLGDERRLALILLQGLEGPVEVNGRMYDQPEILPVMPAHSIMDDGAITAIMTYIRNEWGNDAGPVKKGIVGNTRFTSQGRVVPWTPQELNQHMSKIKEPAP
jgi:mono/diheme cytochrome c family protein/glucose/arabinose dehydrogenase